MTDIKERLRNEWAVPSVELTRQAADRIEELEAEVEELKKGQDF